MSMFKLPTTSARPHDTVTNYKMVEISSDSSNLSGTIRHRFSWSPNQWFEPKESYMLLTIAVSKGDGSTGNPVGEAIETSDGVSFCESPASAIIQQESLNLNGVQVFSNSEVGVSDIMLKRAFMSFEMQASVGDSLFKLTANETGFTGHTVKLGHVPVGGIFSYDGQIPGGQWSLSTNLKSDIVNNLFATGRDTTGLVASVTKVDFMACFVTPINDIVSRP